MASEANKSAVCTAVKSLTNKIKYGIASYGIKRKYSTHAFRPSLGSDNTDFVRCFDAAVHNAADINTVACVYELYNATGLR